MLRALHTSATGMDAQQTQIDIIANNLANVNTTGFKKSRGEFQDLYYQQLRSASAPDQRQSSSPIGLEVGQGVRVMSSQKLFTSGDMLQTGNPLDLAIEGNGFFTVETPGGTAYTRDGRFRKGPDGVVRDGNGNALLGQGGPIRFPADAGPDAQVEVDGNGALRVGGIEVDLIALADFPGYRGLRQAGGSYFFAAGGANSQPSKGRVLQRTLEDANVSGVAEMSRTIETLRAFESYQKMIQSVMDETTGEAVRRIGRVA